MKTGHRGSSKGRSLKASGLAVSHDTCMYGESDMIKYQEYVVENRRG